MPATDSAAPEARRGAHHPAIPGFCSAYQHRFRVPVDVQHRVNNVNALQLFAVLGPWFSSAPGANICMAIVPKKGSPSSGPPPKDDSSPTSSADASQRHNPALEAAEEEPDPSSDDEQDPPGAILEIWQDKPVLEYLFISTLADTPSCQLIAASWPSQAQQLPRLVMTPSTMSSSLTAPSALPLLERAHPAPLLKLQLPPATRTLRRMTLWIGYWTQARACCSSKGASIARMCDAGGGWWQALASGCPSAVPIHGFEALSASTIETY